MKEKTTTLSQRATGLGDPISFSPWNQKVKLSVLRHNPFKRQERAPNDKEGWNNMPKVASNNTFHAGIVPRQPFCSRFRLSQIAKLPRTYFKGNRNIFPYAAAENLKELEVEIRTDNNFHPLILGTPNWSKYRKKHYNALPLATCHPSCLPRLFYQYDIGIWAAKI